MSPRTAPCTAPQGPHKSGRFLPRGPRKTPPVDFATEGVLCRLASPKNLRESIIQGKTAAGRAATVISKAALDGRHDRKGSQSLCGLPYMRKSIIRRDHSAGGHNTRLPAMKAVVNDVLCKGCGTCCANCRCGAVDLGRFTDQQIVSEIEYLLKVGEWDERECKHWWTPRS